MKATRTEASAQPLPMRPTLKNALLRWKAESLYAAENALRLPVATQEWAEASLLGCSAEPKNQARIQHGKTSTHDPRAPQQPQCYQPYLQATSKTMRLSPGRLVDASLPTELLSASKSTLVQ